MRIGIVTREWPPDVYGGAGVHVEHLVAALRSLPAGPELEVHCFGEPRRDEVFDMHAGTAVDVRRPLTSHDPDAHGVTLGGGTAPARRANPPLTGYVA